MAGTWNRAYRGSTKPPDIDKEVWIRFSDPEKKDAIEDYLNKVTSKGGYGFRLFTVPGLLVAHFPAPMDAALKRGWDSKAYKKALSSVDTAIGGVLELYRAHKVLDKTMVIVTGLSGKGMGKNGKVNSSSDAANHKGVAVPWIAWGANVKSGHQIQYPVSIMDTGATVMEALGLETWRMSVVS